MYQFLREVVQVVGWFSRPLSVHEEGRYPYWVCDVYSEEGYKVVGLKAVCLRGPTFLRTLHLTEKTRCVRVDFQETVPFFLFTYNPLFSGGDGVSSTPTTSLLLSWFATMN